MPKHIMRLMVLVAAAAVVGFSAKIYFTDKSYYRYGHYRGDSVAEIAGDTPRFRGSTYCKSCHEKQYAVWADSPHNKPAEGRHVQCEVCHGPVGLHPNREGVPSSFDERLALRAKHVLSSEQNGAPTKLPARKDKTECIQCHEAMPGRPTAQRQVELAAHAGTAPCVSCHDPHAPKISYSGMPDKPKGNAAAGKVLSANCTACHGPGGESTNPVWPNLAGQHATYLINALQAFKSGARPNEMMGGMAAGLNDADMENLAAYFSGRSCKGIGADKAKAALGKKRSASCALCHGPTGVSPNPSWPDLAGQNEAYLGATLKSFKDGGRVHPVMSSVAKTLSDTAIDNLAAFYASANCK